MPSDPACAAVPESVHEPKFAPAFVANVSSSSSVELKSPAMITFDREQTWDRNARSARQLSISCCRGETACTATIVGPVPLVGRAMMDDSTDVSPSSVSTLYLPSAALISSVVECDW